jgi:hypothetical protein
MTESSRDHPAHQDEPPQHELPQHAIPKSGPAHHGHRPSWKRPHHDWRFWVALLAMLLAMVIYVTSQDLAWRPYRMSPPTLQR